MARPQDRSTADGAITGPGSFSAAARRNLFWGFLRRDIATRYSGTVLGGLWAFAQPILLLLIYGFVFRRVFKVSLPDLAPNSFVAYVACVLWPWLAFQEGVQRGTQAIVANGDLVRKIAFPSHLLVLAAVASSFVIHGVGYVAVLGALAWAGEPLAPAGGLVIPLAWLGLFLLAGGVALVLAALQVVLKDIDHVLAPVFMVLFYLSPILYPLSLVPPEFRFWMAFNPLLHVFEPLREALLRGHFDGVLALLPFIAGAAVVFMVGRWVFGRLAAQFEDFL